MTHACPSRPRPVERERELNAMTAGDRRGARGWVVIGLVLLVVVLACPASSAASFERVGVIGAGIITVPEGVAVDDSTSDVYVADGQGNRIVKFDQEGNFLEEWGWGVGDGARKFERCGPTGEPAFPTCEAKAGLESGEGIGELDNALAVAIDQATGDVYVYDSDAQRLIQVFTANGEPVGSGVARQGEGEGEVSLEGTESYGPSLAVDNEGDVYLVNQGRVFGPRVMEFTPKNSKFAENGEYEFKRSLFVGGFSKEAGQLSVDEAGDIYMAKGSNPIYKFAPSELAKPVCEDNTVREVEGMTVDPKSEDVYFYEDKYHRVAVLGTNCEMLEHFETGTSNTEQEDARSGAFSPNGAWVARRNEKKEVIATHPKGILYLGTERGLSHPHPAEIFAFAPFGEEKENKLPTPVIEGSWPKSVGQTFARLEAVVQPNGNDTHVKFEYGDAGPCSSAQCSETPVGGLDVGAQGKPQTASVTLGGLAPNTTYYVRVVASSAAGTVFGPNETFHTFAVTSPALPDGRAYELVTPIEKDGGEVFPLDPVDGACQCEPGITNLSMPMESAETESGEPEVVYEGYPFAVSGESVGEDEYRATRAPTGWRTEDLSPELASRGGRGFRGFTPDLLTGVFEQGEPALSSQAIGEGYLDLYRRGAGGAFTPLLTAKPPHRTAFGTEKFIPEYDGQSSDGSRIFFTANDALTGETAVAPAAEDGGAAENNLYEWDEGRVGLVNVLPGNAETVPGAALGSGKELGQSESGLDTTNAISADGSRVFWSVEATGQVYVRVDGETTIEIPDSGAFLAASASGEEVLLSDGHIYDLATKHTTDITEGERGFQGILGASEDLSKIYFVDTAALTPPTEENAYGAAAKTGEDNLYIYSAASGGVRYIATLASADNEMRFDQLAGDWKASPTDRLAQVTADGEFLAFESHARLTGYDNEALSGECSTIEEVSSAACTEVFEYHAADGSLACVSCNPTGARPAGPSQLSLIAVTGSRFSQPRNVLADGRVFFDSSDVLSSNDGEPGVENVYEYEQDGQDTCALSGGCVSLISSGHSGFGAQFFSATPSGRDVFITTRAQLLPEDHDELVDLYDVREGGGFPAPEAATPCSGEGCRATTPAPESEWTAPLSASLAPSALPGAMPAAPAVASVEPKPRSLTRAQKLARALRACHGDRAKRRRAACERRAHARYGATAGERPSKRTGPRDGKKGR